jgi:NitT/TauT family transport system substrate-binding protein
LNVTITFAPASQLAVTSMLNGTSDTSDISGTDYVTYVDNEINDNARLRIIAEASSLQPHDLELFDGPNSQITTLADLRGRTIGVTSSDDIDTLLVRALLTENGISADSVNIQFGFQLPNIAQQLSAGQANTAPIPEPFATEGEQQYGLQALADVDQGVTTNFPLEGYAVTQAWAQKYPNTLAAFDRALEEGQEIADTNRTAFPSGGREIPRHSARDGSSDQSAQLPAVRQFDAASARRGRDGPVRHAAAEGHLFQYQRDDRLRENLAAPILSPLPSKRRS